MLRRQATGLQHAAQLLLSKAWQSTVGFGGELPPLQSQDAVQAPAQHGLHTRTL